MARRRFVSTDVWVAVVADIHQRQNAHGMAHQDVEALARSVLAAMRKGKFGLGEVPGAVLGQMIAESFAALVDKGWMTRSQVYGDKKKRRGRK